MAAFNPDIPSTQDPNYLFWSRAAQQPQGDKSTGIALSTAAEAGGDALKLADTSMKSIIEQKFTADVHKKQDDYIGNLAAADNAVMGALQGGNKPAGGGPGVLTTSTSPGIPEQLKNLSFQFDGLGNARATGKFSPTRFDGELYTLLKDYRSRFPGYVDYIDNLAKQVTGKDVANDYVRNLLGDINSFASNQMVELKEARGLMSKPELATERMQNAYIDYRNGNINFDQFQLIANQTLEPHYKAALARNTLAQAKDNKELLSLRAQQFATQDIATTANNSIKSVIVDPLAKDKITVEDFIQKYKDNPTAVPSEAWPMLKARVDMAAAQWEQETRRRYSQPNKDPQTGESLPSFSQALGGNAEMEAQLEQGRKFFRGISDAIGSKRIDLMYLTHEMHEAQVNDTTKKLSDKFPSLTVIESLNKTAPKFLADKYGDLTQAGMKPPERAQMINFIANLTKQPDVTMGGDGTPYTISKALDAARPDPTTKSGGSKKLQEEITKIPSKILFDKNLTDEDKVIFANNALFNPANANYIGKITGVDNKGNPDQQGTRFGVWNNMTSRDVTAQMWKLAKGDPNSETWTNYKRWVTDEFTNHIFHQDMLSLNEWQGNPNLQVGYKDGQVQFKLGRNISSTVPPEKIAGGDFTDTTYIKAQLAAKAMNRLSMGMSNVNEIFKMEGINPDHYWFQLFHNMDVKFGDNSVPGQLLRAIPSSHAQPSGGKNPSVTDKALPYDEEDAPASGNMAPDAQRGSLSNYLLNPAGMAAGKVQNAPAANSGANEAIPLPRPRPDNMRMPPRPMNLSDEPMIGIGRQDVPEGADINDLLRRR